MHRSPGKEHCLQQQFFLSHGFRGHLPVFPHRRLHHTDTHLHTGGLYAKFFCSLDGKDYQELAEVPTNILTDEQSEGFTGAHFGMYCHDMTGVRRYADFDYFEIFMQRMMMCRRAAEVLGMKFKMTANGKKVC